MDDQFQLSLSSFCHPGCSHGVARRDFLMLAGGAAAVACLPASVLRAESATVADGKRQAVIRGAFIYPPTEQLDKAGYYSWPGSTFDAEGRQQQYQRRLAEMEKRLDLSLGIDQTPLDSRESVESFIKDVKQSRPDGLLLFPFKKGHWDRVVRIVKETEVPTIILATQGVLLVGHVRQLHDEPETYLINSLNNLDAVESGLKMIRAAHRLRMATIINVDGRERKEYRVHGCGTRVVNVPHQQFYDIYAKTQADEPVRQLAQEWTSLAKKIVQPNEADILDAARAYFALKTLIDQERADAMMMNCLPGLYHPHKHVPPCMGFMKLRDERIPAGCESDLHSTLTMILYQELFDKPTFQHNESVDTETNLYFGAHCTSASRLAGFDTEPEPLELMSHAEAGWGCVPRVLMKPETPVTLGYYLPPVDENGKARMAIYTGEVVRCPPIPETGGCRTNVEVKLNNLEDAISFIEGRHTCLIYGDHGEELRRYCQLMDIEVVNEA